ncbi:hypothetical protein KO504_03550 [Winogradskyella psychrotolerans]|uniref:hypothetical protein n=1 Tax=Winogradskyella psychrotolerans TaxID=1344585 RepID=UPI001C06BA57|nr:hypothetical protein [Winogradskyella psychrotolerans]MBU2920403.1 hypothetical protein [Winogradskyella psychrotolerans]
MNSSTEILFYTGQIISALSTFIILIASIILFIKKRTLATWLILIGSVLVILTSVTSLVIRVFASAESVGTLLLTQGISIIIQNVSYLIFSVGLIILVVSEFSKK